MNRLNLCMRPTMLLCVLSALTTLWGCHKDPDSAAGGGSTSGPPPAVAPSITSQPVDQSVTAGQSVTFSVTASGTAPLTYQWERDGTAIPSATDSAYTLPSAAVSDSGVRFTVIVSNSAGSATSSPGTLTVRPAGTTVSAAVGGQVTSSDGRVTVTLPPNALTADATVTVTAAPDATLPASLSSQFTVITGTTYLIVTQGGALDPAKRFQVSVAIGGLSGLKTAAGAGRPTLSVIKRTSTGQGGLRARTSGTGSSYEDLGLVDDCGDGQPSVIITPPSNDYAGTFVAGCPATGGGSGSQSTISLATWTPNSQPQAPSGNIIWQTTVPLDVNSPGTTLAPYRIDSTTRGDTWMGALPATVSASSVGLTIDGTRPGNEQTLVSLLDGNGQLITQQLLPVRMTSIALDGPGSFYLTLGLGHYSRVGQNFALGEGQPLTAYAAYYSLVFPASGPPVFVQQWETTITGAPATGDGNDVYVDASTPLAGSNLSAVGTIFAVDPSSGDLVGLGGNGNSSGKLTDDEITRLGFAADGFMVRINRSGKLAAAAPVVSTQTLTYMNSALDPARIANFSLRLDHAGNAYIGAIACCDAAGQNPYGISGLTLKKMDRTGAVVWDVSLASPDDISLFPPSSVSPSYPTGPAIAVDGNNDVYVTYSRRYPPPSSGASLYVSKVSADVGAISSIGAINYTVVTYLAGQAETGITSYVDDGGVLYVPSVAAGVQQLIGLSTTSSPILSPIGGSIDSTEYGHADHAYQVDSAGNIYQQQTTTSSTDGYQHNAHYAVILRKYHL